MKETTMEKTITQKSMIDVSNLPFIDTKMIYGKAIEGVDTYLYDTISPELTNLVHERRDAKVHDARSIRDQLSYQDNGFELRNHHSASAARGNDPRVEDPAFLEELKNDYLAEMTEFIKSISGSPYVFPQPIGFFVRHGAKSPIKTAQRPAGLPHIDFTKESALTKAELVRQTHIPDKQFRSFAIYQTWRAISVPPQDNSLCFCDGRLELEKDKRIVESVMGPRDEPGTVFHMDMVLHNPAQQWMYFSDLTEDEVLVFQGYDMRSPRPILHTSFNTGIEGASPRVSIEARHYAFFE
jgi:hypothetical protein